MEKIQRIDSPLWEDLGHVIHTRLVSFYGAYRRMVPMASSFRGGIMRRFILCSKLTHLTLPVDML